LSTGVDIGCVKEIAAEFSVAVQDGMGLNLVRISRQIEELQLNQYSKLAEDLQYQRNGTDDLISLIATLMISIEVATIAINHHSFMKHLCSRMFKNDSSGI